MKEYEILSKSTNGFWVSQGYKEFKNDGEAKTFTRNKSIERGFEYKAKFIRNLQKPKAEEAVETESVETSEATVNHDLELGEEVETTDEDTEELIELSANENESSDSQDDEEEESKKGAQIDYDFADSHDTENFPRGWWLKKQFVAKDGTVFSLKREQPELYRKFKPSEY